MKKVTIILSMFVFAISSQTFAQKPAQLDSSNNKITNKPEQTSYVKITFKDLVVSSAQPKPTAKPSANTATQKATTVTSPKPTPTPVPAVQGKREVPGSRP